MKHVTRWIIGFVVIVLIFWLVSINSPEYGLDLENGGNTPEVKIGGLFGLTDFVAFAGEASRNGFIMAIEDSGMDVDYVIEDFGSDLAQTVTAATKLLTIDDVDVVIGPEWNEFTEVVAPLAEQHEVPFISPWMTSEAAWTESPYILSGTPSERSGIQALLAHMEDSGRSHIALFVTNNAWSAGFADIVEDEIARAYTNIHISTIVRSNAETTDFRTDFAKLGDDVEAVFAVIASDEGAEAFMRQLNELQIDLPVYMPFSRASILMENNVNGFSDGIVFPAAQEYARTEAFTTKYSDRFGVEPTAITGATAYDMTTLVLQALEQGAKTGTDIAEYLRGVQNYEGYTNIITFNERGMVVEEAVELRKVVGQGAELVELNR